MPEGSSDLISNQTNTNRTTLKILNDRYQDPIKAKGTYNTTTKQVEIAITYSKYGINKIMLEEKNELALANTNGIITSTTETVKSGKNHFTIIDNKNNKKELDVTVVLPIYVKLYKDGTLAFTATDKVLEGKKVANSYGDISKKNYTSYSEIPWYNQRSSVKTVDIVDKIAPETTIGWFYRCSDLTDIKNISNLDTSNVTNMTQMFDNCSRLTNLDLSSFDTESVMNMSSMFNWCSGLTKLDLSNFDTSNVKNMGGMFYGCYNLTEINVNSFNTKNVTNMTQMFDGCGSLAKLDISNFNTSNVTRMDSMFNGCRGLTKLDLGNFDTSNVKNMSGMFIGCDSLKELNVSNFNTSDVTDISQMFMRCSSLDELDLSSFDTRNVTEMSSMFYNCTNLKTIYVGANWKLATNRNNMFTGCGTSTTTRK